MEIAALWTTCDEKILKTEIAWQKLESERIERGLNSNGTKFMSQIFMDWIKLGQLSVHRHVSMYGAGSLLLKDRERYISVARNLLSQPDFEKTFKDPQEKNFKIKSMKCIMTAFALWRRSML